jgi:hypothetical protein
MEERRDSAQALPSPNGYERTLKLVVNELGSLNDRLLFAVPKSMWTSPVKIALPFLLILKCW